MRRALVRLRRKVDPRRSVAARLLFAFFLAFLIPGMVFVFLLAGRLTDVQDNSAQQFAAAQLAEASMRLQQDARSRAERMDGQAALAEEAAWSLANAVKLALGSDVPEAPPQKDVHGHVFSAAPENDSFALIRLDRSDDPEARKDYVRLRPLAPLLTAVRERQRSIKNVSVWTASGVMRFSPWVEVHEAIRQSGGQLERFSFNKTARFPAERPPAGDSTVWMSAYRGPRLTPENRLVTLFVPVRNAAGSLIAGVSIDVDAGRYVAKSLGLGQMPGDLWFAIEDQGYFVHMTARVANLLHWGGIGETLSGSSDIERQRLARTVLSTPEAIGDYRFGGRACRLASAKVRRPGWIFVEGFSAEKLTKIESDAAETVQPRSYSELKRYLLLVFAYLLLAVLVVVVLLSRRISAPVAQLVRAAEEIGEGRAVEVAGRSSPDELGRLAAAIDRMGRRVERRVETLRRLHTLLRTAYLTTNFEEVLARSAEAIAAFTRAERVWLYLHDPDTNRLEAAWPGWNMTQELAANLMVSVDARSIASMVFRGGDVYVSNDLDHDPYVNRKLQAMVGASNAMFCPLKTEDATLGVVVATNRQGGFGPEEVDALTSFADAASLLIKNTRLYATLAGTVEELRRASRLKDHFLQNVNHELRTPLTSIVGWTDLLEEQQVDQETLRRGVKQVRQSARLLLALIDDLLDLARMDRGALRLELKPVALLEVIQRSLETVRMMAEARGVVPILAPFPESMPLVRADALRLQQILWNLLANAIKFTPRHGRVIVRVDREPERYLVSVEDDGIGIAESELPHIFERFRQVDGSPTRRHPGMGIGLALARSLVELHGGSIWAESVPGRGSRFTFSLPIRPGDRRTSEQEVAAVLEKESRAN